MPDGDSGGDSGGNVVGVVREVSHLPGQDLLVVVTPDEREVLIPFVSAFVPQIDVSAKRIVISPRRRVSSSQETMTDAN